VQSNSIWQRSPSSPASWPPNGFPPFATIAALIGAIAVYFATVLVLVRVFGVTAQSVRAVQLTPAIVETQVFSYVPILIYIAIVLPALARRSLAEILGSFDSRAIGLGLGGSLLMWLAVTVVGAIQNVFFGHQATQTAVRLFENAQPGIWLDAMAIVAIVLAPFVEELIFRGLIFNALRQRLSFPIAAVGSGILFGLAHAQSVGIAPLAAGGIVLAAVYARSGSLWSSMIAHGLFNGMTLALLLVAGIKT
jgi:uncharacterized protein